MFGLEARPLSQITIPWTPRSPEKLREYRAKGIKILLTLAVLSLVIGAGIFAAADMNDPTRISDWKVILAFLGVIGPAVGFASFLLGGLAIILYRQIAAFLKAPWVAFVLFCGGVFGVCLLVWAHAWVFEFTRGMLAAEVGTNDVGTEIFGTGLVAPLTVREIYGQIKDTLPVPLAAYALWPLQFDLVRDVVALAGIIGFVSIVPVFGIWWERKVAGRIQSRLGPMRVGGWHGWLQSPADGLKLICKEDFIPPEGDALLFKLAPYLTFVPPLCAFIALPFAGAYVFRDLDVALLFILAMLGIEVVGVILAGWASNNKWSVYGAMREACQMVSYEIPMGMSLLIPVMTVGTLQLTAIADAQKGGFADWLVFRNPWCFVAFFTYYTAALASCKRAPFDLPESESELVAGFHTEYSGFRWSLFFFGEYVAMFVVSGLAVILFLGGWKSPFPADWAPTGGGFVPRLVRGLLFEGPILFVLKAAFLYYVQLWIRWTLPRIRIDQVLYACVQVLLPLTMVILLGNTLWILGVKHMNWTPLVNIDWALHKILVGIGVLAVVAMFGIAAFGYANRRRLVGSLVVDHLPGA
ncbi:MAG: NADH-quinone oxidoreductase subunit NuoH [Planctomycetota bacterium]|nr:MAG: NADH-quinone oxidoreductase subunit NuoH [Planctomycetota bacterium]